MRLFTLSVVTLCLAAAPATAQVVWTRLATNLPPSVEVFETGAPGSALHAWYVRADLTDETLVFDATRAFNQTLTVAEHSAREGAYVAVNGGFFSGTQPLSLIASRGYASASNVRQLARAGFVYYPTRGAIAQQANGRLDVAWVYDVDQNGVQTAYPAPSPNAPDTPQPRPTATFPAGGARWSVEAGVGGGPVLVQNGRRRISWTEEVFFGSAIDTTTAAARTVAGRTADGSLLLLVAEAPGLTLGQAADLMVSLGAVEALNLDGGASSALWADGAALLPGGQPVVSALVLRRRNAYYDPLVVDTGSACCYRETGTWTEAPDSLFYGATRSRLNEAGPGQDRAIFTVPQPDDNPFYFCGQVEAWWSPGPDRTTNAAFSYQSNFGFFTSLGSIDQTDLEKAGRWNTVGYVYAGQSGDTFVVTDAATGTTAPAYVSVDAIRILPSACPATERGPGAALALSLAPNPTADAAAVSFSLDTAGDARVEVVDALGRTVREVRVRLAAGAQRVEVETAGLPAGLYVVRVAAGGASGAARLVVVR